MSLGDKCEAAAMDYGLFGINEAIRKGLTGEDIETVPPCDEPAEIGCRGYWLCRGCFEALGVLVAIANRLVDDS